MIGSKNKMELAKVLFPKQRWYDTIQNMNPSLFNWINVTTWGNTLNRFPPVVPQLVASYCQSQTSLPTVTQLMLEFHVSSAFWRWAKSICPARTLWAGKSSSTSFLESVKRQSHRKDLVKVSWPHENVLLGSPGTKQMPWILGVSICCNMRVFQQLHYEIYVTVILEEQM